MLLSELLYKSGLADAEVIGDRNVEIRDIATDSREVTPGALFVAVPGERHNGAQFVPAALKQGASALLIASRVVLDMPATVPVVRVEKVRASVAKMAACFYAPQPKYVVGVTGTDGKTSTVNFARQLFELHGQKAASIGTLGLVSPNKMLDEHFPQINTSPEPVLMHRTFLELAAHQVQHVAIEVSSHGLAQHRVDGVRFTAAAFTNLTRDHLDYHGTEEAYAAAKRRLFDEVLQPGSVAVINADDAHAKQMIEAAAARGITVETYGKQGKDYQIIALAANEAGLKAEVKIKGKTHQLDLPLYGEFQLYNMLAAVGLVHACGIDAQALVQSLAQLKAIHGRLEEAATLKNGARCFVDYAHTPAALENILRTMRTHTKGKLHVVFGCGGDRDVGKRPQMGAAAIAYADHVIVTDDNPRSEDPAKIRAEIMKAATGATEIAGRKAAIEHAVTQLHSGDVLVVAGKGHENYQIIGEQKHAFDDAETIRQAVRAL